MGETTGKGLLLRVLTPAGIAGEIECDSVSLTLAPDGEGRGGGSIGIRHGHIDTVMALQPGPVTAKRNGELLYKAALSEGFASVCGNVVTVIVTGAEKCE